MAAPRAITEIVERIHSDDHATDWTEERMRGYDVTELLVELLGENGDDVPTFVSERQEFDGEIRTLLERDPDIDFEAEIDPDFSLLDVIAPGLDEDADDEDLRSAWRRWRTSILAEGDPHAWTRANWTKRARELTEWMREDPPAEAVLPFARVFAASPAALSALVDALRSWDGDPMEGIRAARSVADGLSRP